MKENSFIMTTFTSAKDFAGSKSALGINWVRSLCHKKSNNTGKMKVSTLNNDKNISFSHHNTLTLKCQASFPSTVYQFSFFFLTPRPHLLFKFLLHNNVHIAQSTTSSKISSEKCMTNMLKHREALV